MHRFISQFFRKTAAPAAAVLVMLGQIVTAQPATQPASAPASKPAKPAGDPYSLTTCPISGEDLGSMGEPVVYDHHGREIKFCCGGCIKRFEAEPDKYIAKINEQIVEQQKDVYPLDTCIVMDEPLSKNEDELTYYVHNNRLFVLCCPGCKKELMANADDYMKKLDEAVIAKQSADYPLQTCPVSGEKLGDHGKPVDVVVANRLIRLCCKGCVGAVMKDPAKYIKLVDEARGIETTSAETKPAEKKMPASKPADNHAHDHGSHEGHNH